MQTKASGMTCSNISLQKQIPPQPMLSQIISAEASAIIFRYMAIKRVP